MSEIEAKYPEHTKLMAISDKSQAIREFVNWLRDEKEILLAKWDEDRNEFGIGDHPLEPLLAEFYDIDLKKIEAEKQAINDAAITVKCPACQAPAGEPCTQPTDTTRRPVTWFHLSRMALAREESGG